MEENTNLWNKKNTDMTVGDAIKVAVIAPLVTVVVKEVAMAAFAGISAGVKKFRNRKPDLTVVSE